METSGTVVTSSVNSPVVPDPSLLALPDTGYSQGLEQFLEKPLLLSQVLWSTQSQGAALASLDFPTATLSQTIHKNKISGFLGFRGTLVLRVQVNANKMMSGKLILSFHPLGNENAMYHAMRMRNLWSISQLPHVQIDAATQTEAILEIPYINPFSHYDLTSTLNQMGRATLSCYVPLRYGTGDSTAEVSIWASWKNVELVTPTYNAQMAAGALVRTVKKKRGTEIAESEAEAAGAKPFSTAMSTMASVASSVATIPLLSSIAAPAAWALNCAAGIASAFGYSKPSNSTAITRVQNYTNSYAGQCDGVSASMPLGLSVDNKVSLLPGFAGTDVDETNISHFVSIPTYFNTYPWVSTDAVGTMIFQIGLEPARFALQRTAGFLAGTATIKDMSPMALMSAVTQYYRGSIGLNIKIAKTSFHSGRLLICYSPGVVTPTTIAHTDYCFREIVDIRENNEWQFIFPFASIRPWLQNALVGRDMSTVYAPYGYVTVFILNPVRAPATVSNTVDILVEAFGADDMEFAIPRTVAVMRPTVHDYAPQMSDQLMPAVKKPIGSSSLGKMEMAPSEYCIGEKLTSILQLVKRETEVLFTPSTLINNVTGMTVRHNSQGATSFTSITALSEPIMGGDMYSIFSTCFLLGRGSTRLTWVPFGTGNFLTASETWLSNVPDTAIAPMVTGTITNPFNKSSVRTFVGDYPVSVQIPQYTPGHSRINRLDTATAPIPMDHYEGRTVVCSTARATTLRMYRSLGDDAQLGYFIGIPPYIVAS